METAKVEKVIRKSKKLTSCNEISGNTKPDFIFNSLSDLMNLL